MGDELHNFDGLSGKVLGDFRIHREIGRGGMGRVYSAEQLSLRRRVALKTLPLIDGVSPSKLSRFHLEAEVAAQLKHPNIVSVFAVGCDQGIDYYAMEYVEGQNLAELIRRMRDSSGTGNSGTIVQSDLESAAETLEWLPDSHSSAGDASENSSSSSVFDKEHALAARNGNHGGGPGDTVAGKRDAGWYARFVADMILQVTSALTHAHQLGVVHRDIKPSNLLLNQEGRVLVTDFGLARIQSELEASVSGSIVGTLRYSSPEQASGKRSVLDERADIYSLGVTLYELLTLCHVFDARDRVELMNQVLTGQPVAPRKQAAWIPRDLETVILKAIEKDPKDRYQTAEEFGNDLRRFLEDRPVLATRPSVFAHCSKWAKRNIAFMFGIAAFLLLGTIGLAVSTFLIARALDRAETQKGIAERHSEELARQIRENALLLYLADMKLAREAQEDRDLRRLTQILRRWIPDDPDEDLRGPEWGYLWQQAHSTFDALRGHRNGTYQVTVSPRGNWFATCGADGKVRVYRAGEDVPHRVIETGQGEVNAVSFDSKGRSIATAGDDGSICVWDLASSRLRRRIPAHDDLAFGVLFARQDQLLVSCSREDEIRLWDAQTGLPEGVLKGHVRSVEAMQLSADGKCVYSVSADKTVRIWELASKKQVGTLRGHKDKLSCVDRSPDGKLLVTGDIGGQVILWDLETEEQLESYAHADGVQSVDFSGDGGMIAVGDRGGTIHLWPVDADQRQAATSWRAHEGRAYGVAFENRSGSLISTEQNGPVRRWSVSDCESQFILGEAGEVTDFAPLGVGDRVVVATYQGLHLFDLQTREQMQSLDAEQRWDYVASRPDSRLVFAARKDGTFGTWDTETGKAVGRWKGEHEVDAIAVIDDQRVAWLSWDWDKGISIVDPANGELRQFIECPGCERLAVSPNREYLAVAVHGDVIDLFRLAAPDEKKTLRGHRTTVVGLAFDPESKTLFSTSNDRSWRSWDVATGASLSETIAHQSGVRSVAVSHLGKTLVTASARDASLRFWNALNQTPIFDAAMSGCTTKVVFSPNGRFLLGLTRDDSLEVIDASVRGRVAKSAIAHPARRSPSPTEQVSSE